MKLDRFQIKLLALFFMFLDHLYAYFPNLPVWFHYLGRLVTPIFFFFMVQGFFHTRDPKKYIIRLFFWGGVMFIGSYLLSVFLNLNNMVTNNIFLSLGCGALLVYVLEEIRNSKKVISYLPWVLLICYLSLFTEANLIGVAITLVFYFFRHQMWLLSVAYVLVSLAITLPMLDHYVQWMMVFAVPFFWIYNGKPGWKNVFSKYLFYVVYPVHLWILYLITNM